MSAIAADIEDCEIAKSAAEKDRDLTRRRKERTDRDLLDAERALAATREEHLRAQAKADRLTELRRELVRLRCSIAQLTSPNHITPITNQSSAGGDRDGGEGGRRGRGPPRRRARARGG